MDITALLQRIVRRLRSDRRALIVVAAAAVLVAAAVADVPARLGQLAPDDPVASDATPTPTRTTERRIPAGPVNPSTLTGTVTDENAALSRCRPGSSGLSRCGTAPALRGTDWLNTDDNEPLTIADLRGRVVLVDFFASSCAACRRDSSYLRAWDAQYDDRGLTIVGVHSPQFSYETSAEAFGAAVRGLGIRYPVVEDDVHATLTTYRSDAVPSKYLIDATGTVRAVALGEGGYEQTEKQIRQLLVEARPGTTLPRSIGVLNDGSLVEAGTTPQLALADSAGARLDSESDLTIGDDTHFRLPDQQREGTFSLGGVWRLGRETAVPRSGAVARVTFRGRKAYQLVAGRGTLTITTSEGVTRRLPVDGRADLRQLYGAPTNDPETLTIRYDGDLEVYTFSFG